MGIAVIGLGNPGERYRYTRHNAGFLTLDAVSAESGIRLKKRLFSNFMFGKGVYEGEDFFLFKPLTYMNRSGEILKNNADYISHGHTIVVVCDNMDLFPGVVRLKKGGGTAGHNGLKSIVEFLGNDSFLRIYVGIGRPEIADETVQHVLGEPKGRERKSFEEGIVLAAGSVLKLATMPPEKVMNEINRIKNIRNY